MGEDLSWLTLSKRKGLPPTPICKPDWPSFGPTSTVVFATALRSLVNHSSHVLFIRPHLPLGSRPNQSVAHAWIDGQSHRQSRTPTATPTATATRATRSTAPALSSFPPIATSCSLRDRRLQAHLPAVLHVRSHRWPERLEVLASTAPQPCRKCVCKTRPVRRGSPSILGYWRPGRGLDRECPRSARRTSRSACKGHTGPGPPQSS